MPVDRQDTKSRPAPLPDLVGSTSLSDQKPPTTPSGGGLGPKRGGDGEVKAATPAGQKPRVMRGG